MKSVHMITGVLAGAAAGILVGILFAPEKGVKTRKNIVGKGNEYADDLKDLFEKFLNTIEEKYETARQSAEDLIASGKLK